MTKPTAEWELEFDKKYYSDNGVLLERIMLKNGTSVGKTATTYSLKDFFRTELAQARRLEREKILRQIGDEIRKFRHDKPGYSRLSAAWIVVRNKVEGEK